MPGSPGKKAVLAWLKKRGWVFTEMTEAQKKTMRRELKICGAATANSGYTEPCSFTPMKNGRCKKHGGKTPKGIAVRHAKPDGSSHYIPPPLLEDVHRAMNDPELLNLTKDLALVEGRIEELKKRVGTGASDKAWAALQQQWQEFNKATKESNEKKMKSAADAIQLILGTGASQAELWEEIQRWQEHRRRLMESESKRRLQMRAIVNIEEALWVPRQLGFEIRQVILEAPIERALQNKILMKCAEVFERYLGRDTPPLAPEPE